MTTDTIIPTAPIQTAINRNEGHEEESKKIIGKYTMIASGAALVPIDFVDVVTAAATQTMMIRELCQLYQVPYADQLLNTAAWSAVGTVVIKAISGVVSSVISKSKVDVQFDLTGAAVAGIYTATVGEFYKLHLRDGGHLEDVKMSDFADYFMEEIKRGDLSLATFTNPASLLKHLNLK